MTAIGGASTRYISRPRRGRQRRMGEAVSGPDRARVVRGRADRRRGSDIGRLSSPMMRRVALALGLVAAAAFVRGGRRPAAARRRHPDRGPRRLLADGAAARPRRADHHPRRRQDLDRLRRAAAGAGDDHDRVRPPRLRRHHRPAGLLAGTPDRHDRRRTARRLCPGAIVGSGYGQALVKLPEQAPFRSPRRSPSSTARQERQPVRARPRPPHPTGPDHLRHPDRDRTDPQGPLRLPDEDEDPEDRRRRRHSGLRLA